MNSKLSYNQALELFLGEIKSKFKNNYEGRYSDLDNLKKANTKCCVCKKEVGVVKEGYGEKGMRVFLTNEEVGDKMSYFVCKDCMIENNLAEK